MATSIAANAAKNASKPCGFTSRAHGLRSKVVAPLRHYKTTVKQTVQELDYKIGEFCWECVKHCDRYKPEPQVMALPPPPRSCGWETYRPHPGAQRPSNMLRDLEAFLGKEPAPMKAPNHESSHIMIPNPESASEDLSGPPKGGVKEETIGRCSTRPKYEVGGLNDPDAIHIVEPATAPASEKASVQEDAKSSTVASVSTCHTCHVPSTPDLTYHQVRSETSHASSKSSKSSGWKYSQVMVSSPGEPFEAYWYRIRTKGDLEDVEWFRVDATKRK